MPAAASPAASPVGRRWVVFGTTQGVGFRPWVHEVALALGLDGPRPQRGPRCRRRGVRRARRARSPGGAAVRPRPAGGVRRGRREPPARRTSARRLPHRAGPGAGDRRASLPVARPGAVPGLSQRDRRSPRPPLRLRVHELHPLRSARDHRSRAALRARAHQHGCFRAVRRVPRRVREPRPPSLPRRDQRLPRVRSSAVAARPRRRRTRFARAGPRRDGASAARRRHRRGAGRRRLPSRLRRHARGIRRPAAGPQGARSQALRGDGEGRGAGGRARRLRGVGVAAPAVPCGAHRAGPAPPGSRSGGVRRARHAPAGPAARVLARSTRCSWRRPASRS